MKEQRFATITTAGAMLPVETLARIASGKGLPGLEPATYELARSESTVEAVSRAWNVLVPRWRAFRESIRGKEAQPLVEETRRDWLIPLLKELDFGSPGRGPIQIDGEPCFISHVWNHAPLHLQGWGIPLDRRTPGIMGADKRSPHSLVQELLNRSPEHLWALVSNGQTLRLLRDNASLSRQAYVEFDLAAMFDGEVFSDFQVLWLTCHATRFAVPPEKSVQDCWLEQWCAKARDEGTAALKDLRLSVKAALEILGSGFLSHPKNKALVDRLRAGELDQTGYWRQLLRVIYRLLFLFAAEDRGLLFAPGSTATARDTYTRYFSAARLRNLAIVRGARSPHADLWEQHALVAQWLGTPEGRPELALPALGGLLFGPAAAPDLDTSRLSNANLLAAVEALSFKRAENGQRERISFRELGSEELGGVYEWLLALHPQVDADRGRFAVVHTAGSDQKTTGSYYTPASLINCLLESALDPVVDDKLKRAGRDQAAQESAILSLKVVDPACGSGHFLVAAAHRLAHRLAGIRSGEAEPGPEAVRHALRDVIGHCIYGVDMNPMAVELCKVGLWLESLEPGRPLGFLDSHIRSGNSLLGTTRELVEAGIPEAAFTALEGDDKAYVSGLKKQNKKELPSSLGGAQDVMSFSEPWEELGNLPGLFARLDVLPDDDFAAVQRKQTERARVMESSDYLHARLAFDCWCAAFVMLKRKEAPLPMTTAYLNKVRRNPHNIDGRTKAEVIRLAREYRFFHWEIEFAHVFAGGGFDLVLGNPPWEQIQFDPEEFFVQSSPDIVAALNLSARKKAIAQLLKGNPELHRQYTDAMRFSDSIKHFIHTSGRYPMASFGRLNTAPLFVELSREVLHRGGMLGLIVPSGLATDSFNQHLFRGLLVEESLVSFYEFENEGFFLGAGQGHMLRFALLTVGGSDNKCVSATFMFQGKAISELKSPERLFHLTVPDFALLNPNTMTCPVFKSQKDSLITRRLYEMVPILKLDIAEPVANGWDFSALLMFMMSADSGRFETAESLHAREFTLIGNNFISNDLTYLPLYEAKMVNLYNHCYGDYSQCPGERRHVLPETPVDSLSSPDFSPTPFYWISRDDVASRIEGKWGRQWFLGWREVTDARASARSVIACIIPFAGVGHKFPLFMTTCPEVMYLSALFSSFVFDFGARQKIGGLALNSFTMKQLPVLPPSTYNQTVPWSIRITLAEWSTPRLLELTYTSRDLQPWAQDMGYDGPPFKWDEERRFKLRCELDAAIFHLYLGPEADWGRRGGKTYHPDGRETVDAPEFRAAFPTPRHAVEHIMDSFPIVRRKDEAKYKLADGSPDYRTKHMILEIYDELQRCMTAGRDYATILSPPPASLEVAHPMSKIGILAFGSLIDDPGVELEDLIVRRIDVETPFGVEFGRESAKRGGGPTLVPHPQGESVKAQVLVLRDGTGLDEARDMLYRREIGDKTGLKKYTRGAGPNSVLVEELRRFHCVETVFYTDFNPEGKIASPAAEPLAVAAIASVSKADPGQDGITYLIQAVAAGVVTKLTPRYEAEILHQLCASSLTDGLEKAKADPLDRR